MMDRFGSIESLRSTMSNKTSKRRARQTTQRQTRVGSKTRTVLRKKSSVVDLPITNISDPNDIYDGYPSVKDTKPTISRHVADIDEREKTIHLNAKVDRDTENRDLQQRNADYISRYSGSVDNVDQQTKYSSPPNAPRIRQSATFAPFRQPPEIHGQSKDGECNGPRISFSDTKSKGNCLYDTNNNDELLFNESNQTINMTSVNNWTKTRRVDDPFTGF